MENTLILRRINFANIEISKTDIVKVVEAFDFIIISLDKLLVFTAITIKGLYVNGQK